MYKNLICNFIVPDVNDVLAEEEEKSMFNPNLLKPTDIPIPEQYIANAKKQKKSMKTLTKLNMQLERNKEAAKKKHKKTTARTILKENIGNTNVLRGADILLIKKHNKKNKNVKRYVLCTFKNVLRNDFILLYLSSNPCRMSQMDIEINSDVIQMLSIIKGRQGLIIPKTKSIWLPQIEKEAILKKEAVEAFTTAVARRQRARNNRWCRWKYFDDLLLDEDDWKNEKKIDMGWAIGRRIYEKEEIEVCNENFQNLK